MSHVRVDSPKRVSFAQQRIIPTNHPKDHGHQSDSFKKSQGFRESNSLNALVYTQQDIQVVCFSDDILSSFSEILLSLGT